MATTRNDKLMYLVLVGAILTGLWATLIAGGIKAGPGGYDYRATVALWFRSVFVLRPDVRLLATAPADYRVHTLVGMALFAIWPFTRLIHAFTVPVHYLFRPYIVYRRRPATPAPGARPSRRGWEQPGGWEPVSPPRGARAGGGAQRRAPGGPARPR